MTRGSEPSRQDADVPGKIRVLFFESGRQGGSAFRLCSIMQRIDPSRFESGVVSYYRDRAAAVLFGLPGLFCRRSLNVPWYPQPDVFKPVFGLPIPTPFGIYLFFVSLLVLWRHRPHVAYMNSGIREFAPAILAARLLGTKVVCALRMSRPLDVYEMRLVRYVHHLVASSQWGAAFYQDQVRDRSTATCVYEGIDLTRFDALASEPLESRVPEGPVYLCQVGSLIDRKRPRLAIEALDIARRQATNLKLILAGDGPLRPELEAFVQERGLQEHVLLVGHRRDIPALLRHCHIGLLLSEDEGLPNAILEYMASSLPMIVTRLPFIDELIRHQHNGLVIDEVTPQAIAEALCVLARSAGCRERQGEASREMIAAGRFSADREARDVEVLLTGIAKATTSSLDDRSVSGAVRG
jgi:glycosyltransferase involved in cell wall biosynthesis